MNALPGVLLEGVDYSGKTVVAQGLLRRLQESEVAAERRACFLHDHAIHAGLLRIAHQLDDLEARDVVYTSCLLHDLSLPPMSSSAALRIQERHVLSQIARNAFFHAGRPWCHLDLMDALRPRFSVQVYLTSSLKAKSERTAARSPNSPRDALLAGDPSLHQKFDEDMLYRLPGDEDWHVVDTSEYSVDEVVEQVLPLLASVIPRFSR